MRIDTDDLGGGSSGAPATASAAGEVTILADPSGFTVTNTSSTDLTVLVTLMAKAAGTDAESARDRLFELTSPSGRTDPLRVALDGAADAYTRLWQYDVVAREHPRDGWVATRSGAVLLPIRAGESVALVQNAEALRAGVVVADIAAVASGVDAEAPLVGIDRGASASIGEAPVPPGG